MPRCCYFIVNFNLFIVCPSSFTGRYYIRENYAKFLLKEEFVITDNRQYGFLLPILYMGTRKNNRSV